MSSERADFRSDIEGLRGLAILLVVLFHAGVSRLAGGYVGVDVFFVLSGFFITGLLAREVAATGDVDLPEFYARRARRLLPAFLVVLLATVALTLWIYAPIDSPTVASDARAVALQYGNVLFADNAVNYHAASSNPFLHTWSLAVEQQFYVLWPLLFALIGRIYGASGVTPRRLIAWVTAAGVLSFVVSLWVTKIAQPWAFFGMPTRIWEFALGGVTALALAHQPKDVGKGGIYYQLAGLIAIAVASVSYHQATAYPGMAAIAPALGTVALLVGGHRAPTSAVSNVLGSRLLQWFGRMSYTWYLWHWPIVGMAAVINWEIGVVGRLVWSGVALALAGLTHRFVEKPWREGSSGIKRSPQLVTAVAFGASIVAALLAHGAMVMAERRAASPVQRPFAAARDDGMAHDCWGSLLENATAPCIFGDKTSQTTVVLLGDSHAEHWLPAVDRIGRERHWKIVAMVKPACPVADMPELVNARLKRAYAECTSWRRMMLRRIVAMHPSIAILSSWDHYMPPDGNGSEWQVTPASWRRGLRRTYSKLSSAGINTVVIRGTPRPGFDPPACLSRAASGAPFKRRCDYDRAESLHPPAIAAQNDAARGLDHIAFVDVNDRICPTARCSVVQRGSIVYRDDGHLTATFSLAEAPILGARIVAATERLHDR